MDRDETQELEQPDNWDYDNAERRRPVRGARAVVSVAFSRADFEQVAAAAEHVGQRTSEFIRQAAMERANKLTGSATLTYSGGSGWTVTTHRPLPVSRVSGANAGEDLQRQLVSEK